MAVLMIFILWTWGLTPVWVNIIGTVLMGLKILYNIEIPDGKKKDE